jgi:hypothetical protein
MRTTEQSDMAGTNETPANWLETVREQVSSLRFGLVQIVVHNGRVVQLEKTEKIRFSQTNDH